ncbi:MAG: HD family phosphohydrolase [Armatimonadota bacterium]
MASRHHRPRNREFFGYQVSNQRLQRWLVGLLTALLVFVLLMARLRPEAVSYQVGDAATQTIRAQRAAAYVDKEATERLRDEAAASVPDLYSRDANAEARALQTVRDVFGFALAVQSEPEITALDRVDLLRERLDLQLSPTTVRLLVESSRGTLDRLQQAAVTMVRQSMAKQIRSNTDDLQKARSDLGPAVAQTNLTPRYRSVLLEIAQVALQPNLIYDATGTTAKRDEARSGVEDVRRQLQPGDVVVAAGETVEQRHLDMFTALGLSRPTVDYLQALTLLGTLLCLTLAVSLFLRSFVPEVYYDDQLFVLVCATLIVTAGAFSLFKETHWFYVFGTSTASAAAIFLALTTRPLAAAGAALYIGGLLVLASPGGDAHILLIATLCALFASHFVHPRESRSSTITRSALLTAITNVGVYTVISYVFGFGLTWVVAGQVAVGGFLAAIAAAGVITVIERPLKLTTHLRLLELQNPNEPVLKRLLTEAPGSYQSSVMVANIAEPAADAIGADPVLTRTCCMYHDIGKLKRSYFFVENQFGAENPHERLSPHLSALVLMSHVKDGIEMAEEAKLPPAVASIIPQHHGTGLVSFMYQRAQAEAAEGEEIRESDFRYPGPKPQTRENAIIMLADTVEAAARTLDEPTRPKIEAMVERLVDARVEDGQLDESPLTFADITVIKKSFVNTLAGMFHQRLAYPPAGLARPNGKEAAAAAKTAPEAEQVASGD